MTSSIPQFSAHDDTSEVITALDVAGCAVITDLADDGRRAAVLDDLDPYLDASRVDTDVDPDAFYPGHTKRITALVAKSPAVRDLVMHPTSLAACDHFLLPNCAEYQLHVASALVIGPRARTQVLHREDDAYPFFDVPRPHLVVATMWALSDFTADNGGTLLVPGSHRWEAGRVASPDEVVAAEMPAGAVLIWLGGTLHGAGPNTTESWRQGAFVSYSLGWLRQEENQFLDVPPEIARTLPKELRALVGYKMHGGSLGFFDGRSELRR